MLAQIISVLLIGLLVAVDQLIKHWASTVLAVSGTLPFIPYVCEFRFLLNQGAAFSVLSGKQVLLIVFTGICLVAMAYYLFFRRPKSLLVQSALILLLGGGLGNLIDRVSAGQVVDYLNLLFIDFPVFNFADVAVCCGVGLWIVALFLEPKSEERAEK